MSQLIRTPPTQPGSALRCTTRPYRGPQTARSDRSGVGQDLATIAGHQQGVLELGTAATVLGDHRPVVLPHVPLVGAQVEHRLDGEGQPRTDVVVVVRVVVVSTAKTGVEVRADGVASE